MFYKQRPDVRIQHVEGETLVLDEQNGYIHQFNHTASFIWRQCDGQTSTLEVVRRLAQAFDLEEVVAARDVAEVIKKLRELRLLSD